MRVGEQQASVGGTHADKGIGGGGGGLPAFYSQPATQANASQLVFISRVNKNKKARVA